MRTTVGSKSAETALAPIPKNIVALDFETYYDQDYTLKKLSTSEYVRDPRFKVHGMAIRLPRQKKSRWISSKDVPEVLASIDWTSTALLAHHAQFDGLILSHHYGVHPCFMFCTMSMARALYSHDIGASLDEVAQFLGKGAKIRGALEDTKGVRDLSLEQEAALGTYAIQDNDLALAIFEEMRKDFPDNELRLIDITVRAFTDPVLEVDIPRAQAELERELEYKRGLIERVSEILKVDSLKAAEKVLSSAEKYAAVLEELGVEVPLKWSEKQKKYIPALAKSDLEFQELEGHPDPNVQALYHARLGIKSTIIETRAGRLIGHAKPKLPLYLNYYRAHTGRWCLTGDTAITVLRGDWVLDVPITEVDITDLVWDGEEFVKHEGVVFSGFQEVITYDGITGTQDHRVYCEGSNTPIPLAEAAARDLTLQTPRKPSQNDVDAAHARRRDSKHGG